eukprot:Colp12_sorted_trinity150504_noHs@35183
MMSTTPALGQKRKASDSDVDVEGTSKGEIKAPRIEKLNEAANNSNCIVIDDSDDSATETTPKKNGETTNKADEATTVDVPKAERKEEPTRRTSDASVQKIATESQKETIAPEVPGRPLQVDLAAQKYAKYQTLISTIEDLDKEVRLAYGGNKKAIDRLKRNLHSVRTLQREVYDLGIRS